MGRALPAPLRQRLALTLSTASLMLAAILVILWAQSMVRGVFVNRRTIVESGSVIEGTDPNAPPVTEYISHTRSAGSHMGRMYAGYMRAEELNKSTDLPRRVEWELYPSHSRSNDRYDAPEWATRVGFDWKFGKVRQGGRPNGEYWSNRDIFVSVPYWPFVLLFGAGGWLIGRRPRLLRAQLRRGLCVACGYDVRETTERCPECGRVPPAAQRAAAPSASA
ncbi:MAG: zinc ribbon domain-containing protein [Planctomycetota bacterium]|nr:zinc ribbon domain-containing protein [Planctomycetota bacterium]